MFAAKGLNKNHSLYNIIYNNSVYIEAQCGSRSRLVIIDSMFVLDNVINWFISNKKKLYCVHF